jgi:perosamine synthetase
MKNIPLGRPSINQQEVNNVTKVLNSGWLTHGEYNLELEELIKKYFQVNYVCLLNSCASALLVSLLALDLPPNGEVILPSFTFSASANAIVLAGLKPIFAEIDYQTGNLDVSKLNNVITNKTVAIMPVHFAGQSCDMSAIMKLALKHKLKVVEDSAECIGGKWKNKFAGTFGDLGCFSFWATKNLTTGEGGAVITNSAKLADKIKTLSAHGISSSTLQREKQTKPWLRNATVAGYNFRLSNLQAAVGVAQMKKLKNFNQKRRQLSQRLTKKLSPIPQIITPTEVKNTFHVYQMYAIKLNGVDRTEFIAKLKALGIQASVHFDPPVHRQSFYKKFSTQSLPITDKLSQTEVTLPMYPDMTFKDIDYIAATIKNLV